MNKKNRFVIAAALTLALLLAAGGVWAAPRFQGTVPPPPDTGSGTGTTPIDMGTALFTPQCTSCTFNIESISNPENLAPAPDGKAFVGDAFKVTANPVDALVQVCYAYPPELANKGAKSHRLNVDVTPNVWVEIPGAIINNGTICVASAAGSFALIGNP